MEFLANPCKIPLLERANVNSRAIGGHFDLRSANTNRMRFWSVEFTPQPTYSLDKRCFQEALNPSRCCWRSCCGQFGQEPADVFAHRLGALGQLVGGA